MANIMEILGRIKTAIYGRDVRQSIYDAILQCYNDATGNPESIAAHTGDTDNPHNVTADQVGLGTAAEDISGLKNPEFEDFAADGSTPPDARTAIAAITSKMSFFTYLSKVKAALMGLVTLGEMRSLLINNGLTTEAGKYFLDAAYGKTLADLIAANATSITKLNSEVGEIAFMPSTYIDDPNGFFNVTGWATKMHISLLSISGVGWAVVVGVYDYNNGTPKARQLAVGTTRTAERSLSAGTWSPWE